MSDVIHITIHEPDGTVRYKKWTFGDDEEER